MRLSSLMVEAADAATADRPRQPRQAPPRPARSAPMYDPEIPTAEEVARYRAQLAQILRGAALRQRAARAEARRVRLGLGDADDDERHDYRLAAVIRAMRLRREMYEVAVDFWRRRVDDALLARIQARVSYAAALAV